jgi:hypothetical protein
MGAGVVDEDGATDGAGAPAIGPAPFRLDNLLLLSNDRSAPLHVEGITLVFDAQGVEVSAAGDPPRVLPWSSLSTHVVEPWSGEVTPEWWVDPELNRTDEGLEDSPDDGEVIDPDATNRAFPRTEPGALISLRTPFATYRFLVPGGHAEELSPKVAELALSHQGPTGAPSVTTVLTGPNAHRGQAGVTGVTWRTVQPILVVFLVVFLVTVVVLILLQSAGTIHLPFLGGANPGSVGRVGAVRPAGRG